MFKNFTKIYPESEKTFQMNIENLVQNIIFIIRENVSLVVNDFVLLKI